MRSFTKDTIITMGTKNLQMGLGFLSSIIVARVLGPEGRGVYALIFLLPSLLILTFSLGIENATVFYIGRKKYELGEIAGAILVFAAILGTAAVLSGLFFIYFFGEVVFPSVKQIFLVVTLLFIPFQFYLALLTNMVLGLGKIGKYNFIGLLQGFSFCIFNIFLLIALKMDLPGAIVAYFIAILITCSWAFFVCKKEGIKIRFPFHKRIYKDFLFFGSQNYLGSLGTFFHLRIDVWMISMFLSTQAVGHYSIAAKLSEEVWLVSLAAATILFQRVTAERDEKRLNSLTPRVCRNVLFITFIMALGVAVLAPCFVIWFYSDMYMASILPFQVLLVASLAWAGSRILGNDMTGRGRPMIYTGSTFASLLVNIVLNILLVKKYGIAGIAAASAISYTCMFLILLAYYKKVSGNSVSNIILIKREDFTMYKNIFLRVKGFFKSTG